MPLARDLALYVSFFVMLLSHGLLSGRGPMLAQVVQDIAGYLAAQGVSGLNEVIIGGLTSTPPQRTGIPPGDLAHAATP